MGALTEHYGLHQWAPSDNFLRSDFNEDFLKVDTALHGLETNKADQASTQTALSAKLEATFGTFTGNGGTYVCTLGFRPKAVLVASSHAATALAHIGISGEGSSLITITSTGFTVKADKYTWLNPSGVLHAYMAFR